MNKNFVVFIALILFFALINAYTYTVNGAKITLGNYKNGEWKDGQWVHGKLMPGERPYTGWKIEHHDKNVKFVSFEVFRDDNQWVVYTHYVGTYKPEIDYNYTWFLTGATYTAIRNIEVINRNYE